jgi:hypothetical protein
MKLKTTKTQIKNNFNTIVSIGYCDIQYLTYYKNPFAYSSGVNGWACDYYEIENVCLSTGYNPIGQNINYNLVRKYELKAQKIVLDYNIDYKIREKKVNKLLIEFIKNL